ncbi:MAG: AIPR family protein [Prevotella sp.]|nr:AIPR family protein [Prevotella sp.]
MEANINDFKLLNIKCQKCFNNFVRAEGIDSSIVSRLDNTQKARYGFYFFILEMNTGIADYSDLVELITDTEFNGTFYDDRSGDEGIDAVYIDEEKKSIQLYSFKYRSSFKQDQVQRKNELIETTKFLQNIQTKNFNHTSGKTKERLEEICELFYDSTAPWFIELFFVTNDTIAIDPKDANVSNFKKALSLKTSFISLNDIAKLLSFSYEPICSKLVIDDDAMMSYKESKLSSDTSYIFRLSLTDLIRITCDDKDFRNQTDIYNKEELANAHIAYDVLSENVRGFILKSDYNKNIRETLEESPSKFFMFNNGITIIASDVKVTPFPNGIKSHVTVENLQVLNGGQTLRTIHKYNQDNKLTGLSNLQKAEILVRIFKVTDKDLMNKIAEYTNSQNAISNRDLKSISSEQIQLESYLDNYGIQYIRKNGDIGEDRNKNYEYVISMEKLGQILYAVKGNPENSTNKKRLIFESEYKRLFLVDDILSEKTVSYIKNYFSFRDLYKTMKGKKPTELKVFYFLYIKSHTSSNDKAIINRFENFISKYGSLPVYNRNRQMLTTQFRNDIDILFSI